jgi:hypothetical protein
MSARTSQNAGEICSLEKAKALGIYDTERDRFYTGLENMRTYSPTNPNDYRRSEALCRTTNDGSYAYPLCTIEHGLPYTQVPGDPSRCIAHACPPGFTSGANNQCIKPDSPIFMNKRDLCEEKPFDWYSIPYFHLGNGYRMNNGKCYKPCEGTGADMPLVLTDPVDNVDWALEFNSNQYKTDGSQCIPIQRYMNGKYGSPIDNASMYCPIAIAKRLSTTTAKLQTELKENAERNMEEIINQLPNSTLLKINSKLGQEAADVAQKTKQDLVNIKTGSRQMKIACERLATEEEVSALYGVCKDFKTRPSQLLNEWRTDNRSLEEKDLNVRRTIMEQACHEVFCNNPHLATQAGGEPLCFTIKKVADEDLKRYNENMKAAAVSSAAGSSIGSGGDGTNAIKLYNGSGVNPDTGFADSFYNKSYKTVFVFLMTMISLVMLFIIGKIIWAIAKNILTPYTACVNPGAMTGSNANIFQKARALFARRNA